MRTLLKYILILLVVFAIVIFLMMRTENGGAALVNAITPSKSFSVEKNIAYGDHERQQFDFYTATDSDDSKPLLVFVHGGGWTRGDKKMYKFVAEGLTSEGYDVALPNYRLYPEVNFPAFLDDTANAIAAIHRKHPSRYLVLIGHSAGAYNALMMGFRPGHLDAAGIDMCHTVKGIVSLASPTGGLPAEEEPTISIFPDRFTGNDGALQLVDRQLPPMLLINGETDTSVDPGNASILGEALKGRKVAKVNIYPDTDHVDVVKQFSRHFDHQGKTKSDTMLFIEKLPDDEGDGFCR